MSQTRYKQIMRTFAARLQAARKRRYRSAQMFAAVCGLEPHTYRKYERGQSEPNFDTLMRICELLDVDAGYLLPRMPAPGGSGGSEDQKAA